MDGITPLGQHDDEPMDDGLTPEDLARSMVHIVDDNKELCSVLSRYLERQGLRCQTYFDAESLLNKFDPRVPGCLVLDIRMPGMDGIELLQALRAKGSRIPVLFLTAYAEVNVVLKAFKLQMFDFLEKPVSNRVLLDRVRRAVAADIRRMQLQTQVDEIRARYNNLTPRELQVMGMVVDGYANKKVGAELGLSQKTVEVHRSNVMKKMEARSLAELVQMWMIMKEAEEEGGGASA